ncbi:MAG: phosphotransferase [Alphaproteobacteria bacterium]|nr:phosphotransferase [Alphaproteobacteria bacterium]
MTSQRAVEIAGFLAQQGWDNAAPTPLDSDFSSRRYARLEHDDGRRAILMDAEGDPKTESFIDISGLLRGMDISAPEIYAADTMHGLVLMEDFGSRKFGNLLDGGGEAAPLYRRAVDLLVHMHRNFDREKARALDLPVFGGALFAAQVEMFLDAYFPYAQNREATAEEAESFRAAWKQALKGIESTPQSLLLRDFMSDNLMDLPKREAWRSVGVLDFQDAGLGPIAYDLASLCEEVRRDGGGAMLDEMIAYYHQQAQPALSLGELKSSCHVLSAQRHMRILGIIVQVAQKTGQREKLAYLPRVKGFLQHLLRDDALKAVRVSIEQSKSL